MDSFSVKNNLKNAKKIQIDDIDEDLRNRIWKCIYNHFIQLSVAGNKACYETEWAIILNEFFKLNVQKFLYLRMYGFDDQLHDFYSNLKWFEIYDFIEFLNRRLPGWRNIPNFIRDMNEVLEHEASGYRIIKNVISPNHN